MIEYLPFIYLFDSSSFNEELRHVCFLSDHTFKWESWCTSLLWCNQNGSLSFEIDNNHFMALFCSHPLHVLSYLTKTSRRAAVNKWLTLHDWPLSKYFALAEIVKEHGRSQIRPIMLRCNRNVFRLKVKWNYFLKEKEKTFHKLPLSCIERLPLKVVSHFQFVSLKKSPCCHIWMH